MKLRRPSSQTACSTSTLPPVTRRSARAGVLVAVAALAAFACNRPLQAAVELPAAEIDLVAAPAPQGEVARAQVVLAGGCFWCTEAVFEQLHGVTEVVSGYAGGSKDDADYQNVSAGLTDHAEVIRVVYDPTVISYGTLLRVFFSTAHDPTQLDRQGNDRGRQYRSSVFFDGDEQKRVAQAYIAQLDETGLFDKPIATRMEPLTVFYPAEAYHQDYAVLNPRQGYVAAVALPKVAKTRKYFADLLKPDSAK